MVKNNKEHLSEDFQKHEMRNVFLRLRLHRETHALLKTSNNLHPNVLTHIFHTVL